MLVKQQNQRASSIELKESFSILENMKSVESFNYNVTYMKDFIYIILNLFIIIY